MNKQTNKQTLGLYCKQKLLTWGELHLRDFKGKHLECNQNYTGLEEWVGFPLDTIAPPAMGIWLGW